MQSDSIPLPESPPVEYRDIKGFPGYRVGDDGSVWSQWELHRHSGRFRSKVGEAWARIYGVKRELGYLLVDLRANGRSRKVFIHRLVLEAFVGPCPEGMECCHAPDRDPSNNRLDNLRWGTKFDNQSDRKLHGTDNAGSRHPLAKHTEAEIIAVRTRFAAGGIRKFELAKEYGMTNTEVGKIIKRVIWKHV